MAKLLHIPRMMPMEYSSHWLWQSKVVKAENRQKTKLYKACYFFLNYFSILIVRIINLKGKITFWNSERKMHIFKNPIKLSEWKYFDHTFVVSGIDLNIWIWNLKNKLKMNQGNICFQAEFEQTTIDTIYVPNNNKIKIYEIFFQSLFMVQRYSDSWKYKWCVFLLKHGQIHFI